MFRLARAEKMPSRRTGSTRALTPLAVRHPGEPGARRQIAQVRSKCLRIADAEGFQRLWLLPGALGLDLQFDAGVCLHVASTSLWNRPIGPQFLIRERLDRIKPRAQKLFGLTGILVFGKQPLSLTCAPCGG